MVKRNKTPLFSIWHFFLLLLSWAHSINPFHINVCMDVSVCVSNVVYIDFINRKKNIQHITQHNTTSPCIEFLLMVLLRIETNEHQFVLFLSVLRVCVCLCVDLCTSFPFVVILLSFIFVIFFSFFIFFWLFFYHLPKCLADDVQKPVQCQFSVFAEPQTQIKTHTHTHTQSHFVAHWEYIIHLIIAFWSSRHIAMA